MVVNSKCCKIPQGHIVPLVTKDYDSFCALTEGEPYVKCLQSLLRA